MTNEEVHPNSSGQGAGADGIGEHADRKRRCPMLGHEIHFGYCLAPGSAVPCRKIIDCWWRVFDVQAFLRRHVQTEDLEAALKPPKDKTLTLLELIEKARKACKPADKDPT